MATGLIIQRSANGMPLSGFVDFRKYPEFTPMFEEKEIALKKKDPKNPAVSGVLPRGYISSDEFWSQVRANAEKMCKEYGIV